MKSFSKLLLTILLLIPRNAEAWDLTTADGRTWLTWNPEHRVAFVEGFMLGQWTVAMKAFAMDEYSEDVAEVVVAKIISGTLTDLIDRFYADPKNLQTPLYAVIIKEGGSYVRSVKSFKG